MSKSVEIEWNGEAASEDIERWAREGLGDAVEYLLTEANTLVPLDEGTLERSGVASVDDTELVGAVSYDTPYAVRQHEEMEYRHDPGRQAKYLEQPWNEKHEEMAELIAAPIRRGMAE